MSNTDRGASQKTNDNKLIEYYKNFDLYMILELFVFLLSFIFLLFDDNNLLAYERNYLYHFNTILLVDFTFRLIIKYQCINIEYISKNWNDVYFILPLIMWFLAAFYNFDNVFGSNPVQVLNILFFVILNLCILVVIILKFVSLTQIKNLFSLSSSSFPSEPVQLEQIIEDA